MEKLIIAAWLCCCFCITAGADSLDAGDVEIENCHAGFIDIRENANNTIKCKGFNGSDIIGWGFKRNDENITNGVATCDASSNCTVHQPDHFAVERSPSHSTLFYQQYDRQVDKDANVICASFLTSRSKTCTLNVINLAKLSSCVVEEDRDRGTLGGSCRFEHAYSDRRGFECNWFRDTDGQSKRFIGIIKYDSGPQSPGGWCTFISTVTTLEPGTYTYSIDFYPGPGNITVNVENIENSTIKERSSSSIAAIVGGCVGGAVVIVIAVVIVVVKFKLRDTTYAKPTRRLRSAEPEHVYNDLHSNTAAITITTTSSNSIATSTVNKNQPGEESSGV